VSEQTELYSFLIVLLDVSLRIGVFQLIIIAQLRISDWLDQILHGFKVCKAIIALGNHEFMWEFREVGFQHFNQRPLVRLHY
jgi:hypothetical protein